jgi:competence protein ComEC
MLQIDCWDVAQGDCTVIRLPDGKLFLIDTGDRTSPVVSWLAEQRARIHTIALTHNDSDHAGALPSILMLPNISVETVRMVVDRSRDSTIFKRIFDCALRQHALRRLNLDRVEAGIKPIALWESDDCSVSIKALYPSFATNTQAKSANATSAVIALFLADEILAIWPGDAPMSVLSALLQGTTPTLLFGPHHGAPIDKKHSTFIANSDSFEPNHVFVSVGSANTYGHPAPEYIKFQGKRGCTVTCSQLTRQCDRNRVANKQSVLDGSMLLGLRAPAKGIRCRGAMRFKLQGNSLIPDEFFDEHRKRVRTLQRPMCQAS